MPPSRTIKQLTKEVEDLKQEVEKLKKRAKRAERKNEKYELARESADLLETGSNGGAVATAVDENQATSVLRRFTDLMLEGTLGEEDKEDICAICTDQLSLESGLLQLFVSPLTSPPQSNQKLTLHTRQHRSSQCQHIFCASCVSEYIEHQEKNQFEAKCPKCNAVLLPDEDTGVYETSPVTRMEDARWDDLLALAQEAARLIPQEEASDVEEGSTGLAGSEEEDEEEEAQATPEEVSDEDSVEANGGYAFNTETRYDEYETDEEDAKIADDFYRKTPPPPRRRREEDEVSASAKKRARMEELVAKRQNKARKL